MDSKLILEAARGTLDGTLSFPEVVGKLLAAGVEYYHVDYVGLRQRFYSADGEMMATSINYEGLPPVAPEFDAAATGAGPALEPPGLTLLCHAATMVTARAVARGVFEGTALPYSGALPDWRTLFT